MVKVRRVQLVDRERVFRLSNDPVVRAVSFQQSEIGWESHVQWFERQLVDPLMVFYVGFVEGALESEEGFVGQIRFRGSESGDAEISLSLTPNFRGKGWGRALMQAALEALTSDSPVRTVHAKVKLDNVVSNRFFQSFGFSLLEGSATSTEAHYVLQLSGEKSK